MLLQSIYGKSIFFVRTDERKAFRWDAALALLSWLGFIAYSITMAETMKFGSLVDIWNLPVDMVMQWGQLANAEELIYSVMIFATKLSVLLLYLHAFVPVKTWVYYSIIFVIVFDALFYIANTFIVAFNCNPWAKIWDPTLPGTCIDVYSVIIGTAALNVISDFMMILIPMAVIWGLHMPYKRKVKISVVFAFGSLAFMSSIARLISSVLGAKDPNQTVALAKIALWTFGEITACFLASCVPMIPPFFRHLRGKTRESGGPPPSANIALRALSRGTYQERNDSRRWPHPNHSWGHDDEPYLMESAAYHEMGVETRHVPDESHDITVSTTVDTMSYPHSRESTFLFVPTAHCGRPL